jgi:hypothetical protein
MAFQERAGFGKAFFPEGEFFPVRFEVMIRAGLI